jgi:hypothetical protein
MSRQPESVFIESIHRYFPPVDELYRCKMHNDYNAGIADVWYSGVRDLWVEYKFIQVPVRDTTLIDFVGGKSPVISALQQDWLTRRAKEGRSVGVIVGCKDGGVWYPGLSALTIVTSKTFRDNLLSRKELAALLLLQVGP